MHPTDNIKKGDCQKYTLASLTGMGPLGWALGEGRVWNERRLQVALINFIYRAKAFSLGSVQLYQIRFITPTNIVGAVKAWLP